MSVRRPLCLHAIKTLTLRSVDILGSDIVTISLSAVNMDKCHPIVKSSVHIHALVQLNGHHQSIRGRTNIRQSGLLILNIFIIAMTFCYEN